MARRPLPVGTHGAVNVRARVDGTWYPKAKVPEGVKPDTWVASTRFRGADGNTAPIKRSGDTENKAKAALGQACREAVGSRSANLNPDSRFTTAADLWIAQVRARRSGSTYDTYRRWLDGRVRPALGELRLRECTVSRLQDFEDALAATALASGEPLSPNSRRQIRKVVSGVLQYAVRREILATNPAKQVEKIEGGTRKKPRAYDRTEAAEFLAKVDGDERARRGQLDQLIRFMFNTGTRASEVLAVRWQELNLTGKPVKVSDPVCGEMVIPPHCAWISGNIVRVTGKGLLRHGGKTFASVGLVGLPPSLVTMLLVQRPVGASDQEPVFPSTTGGWRDPNNLQTSITRLCRRIKVEDFTSHIARKTYGTALDAAAQTGREVADALRKASVRDTQETYMGRKMVNAEAPGLIDEFFRPVAG